MRKSVLFCFSMLLVFASFSVPDRVAKKADKEISKFFDIKEFEKETLTFSSEIADQIPSEVMKDNLFKISANNTFLGYGYIGNAPSKTATFDYLVLFDKDFIITKSKVLIYREEYGGEISSKRWLGQFTGASSKSKELKYNEDIIPISGATISVQSMTRAMNALLQSISKLQELNAI